MQRARMEVPVPVQDEAITSPLYLASGTQGPTHPHVRSGEDLVLDGFGEFADQPGVASQHPAYPRGRTVSLPNFRQYLNKRARVILVATIAFRCSQSKQTYLCQCLDGLVVQAAMLLVP